MKKYGIKNWPDLHEGAKEIATASVAKYLARKSGVTISSVVWSSDPTGLNFSTQTDGANSSSVLVTVPSSAMSNYTLRAKFTFSDGAIRYVEGNLKVLDT